MLSTLAALDGDARLEQTWIWFCQIFGSAASVYGREMPVMWVAQCQSLHDDELVDGILGALQWAKEFPPTLPQFLGLCRQRPEECHQPYQALPKPEMTPERKSKAQEQVERIRSIVGLGEPVRLAPTYRSPTHEEINRHRRAAASILETLQKDQRQASVANESSEDLEF